MFLFDLEVFKIRTIVILKRRDANDMALVLLYGIRKGNNSCERILITIIVVT